jgi:hypothetical protein
MTRKESRQRALSRRFGFATLCAGVAGGTPGPWLRARTCQDFGRRHASAARLYADAFEAQPTLAEDPTKAHRYNGACAAALAGTGQGEEAKKLSNAERGHLRKQAHAWLEADLELYAKLLTKDKQEAVMQVAARLEHWQRDPDLAAVREPKELGLLSQEERKSWQNLWASVRQLEKDARAQSTDARRP